MCRGLGQCGRRWWFTELGTSIENSKCWGSSWAPFLGRTSSRFQSGGALSRGIQWQLNCGFVWFYFVLLFTGLFWITFHFPKFTSWWGVDALTVGVAFWYSWRERVLMATVMAMGTFITVMFSVFFNHFCRTVHMNCKRSNCSTALHVDIPSFPLHMSIQ